MPEVEPNQARSRPPRDGVFWAVLRPKLAWRIGLPPLFVWALMTAVDWTADDAAGSLRAWAAVVGLGLFFGAAWRQRIELRDGTLYRRRFGRWSAIAAVDIEEVTLHYDTIGRDYPHRVLTLITYDKRKVSVSFRWWSNWWMLIRWLVEYCTRQEDDQLVWAVRTDAKTRERLQPYARPLGRPSPDHP